MELESYLDDLASAAPTPGGGSAATIVAALGASLVAMVARITAKNPAFTAHAAHAESIVREAGALSDALLAARVRDESAYGAVVAAQALPRTTPDEKAARAATLQTALAGAAAAPLDAATLALAVLRLVDAAEALGNAHLASDVASAAIFARAAIAASAANVRINHAFMRDASVVAAQEATLRDVERAAAGP